jgi:hypothetical protein
MSKFYLTLVFVFTFALSSQAQWMWNINQMNDVKNNIHSPQYIEAYNQLIEDADRALTRGPWSVTFKEGIAPSGDQHDYVSMARYVWPDPTKPDGLPYVHRDGESNPELEKYDRNPLGYMANAVTTLSLAYFFSGEDHYAEKATELLRVWFLNEDTRMNPHLYYAQFVPGVNDNKGRPFGLIDTYSFVEMLNAIPLLETSKHYIEKDKNGLQAWFREFIHWWKTSEQGIAEKNGRNNHGLAYDVQLVIFSLFADDKETALEVMNEFPTARLFTQIEPDGSQPHELRRTLAYHYSVYNLYFMVDMAAIANGFGINTREWVSPDGRSIYKAVDFLTPYLGKEVEAFPYRQISGWERAQQALCRELYRISSIDPSRTNYLALYHQFSTQVANDRLRLLYGAR